MLQIHDAASVETKDAYLKHLKWLEAQYGQQTFVNLVNQKGSELLLAQGFAKQLIHSPQVHYVAFDFHKECSNLRWHRLSLLLDQIKSDIDANSYFKINLDMTVQQLNKRAFYAPTASTV